ncbi:hypothetical protein LCGC14_0447950 [marine sediment metagenome]|uniref:Uncharacterized protein n=1 Tax=marine sediment metagenome TaxID=412755 RepID=A0A0F9SIM3_9ZZZZ
MKRIICWLIGHNWFVFWSNEIRFQKGMETFRYKCCTRCPKTKRFDIQKAEKPLPSIDCGQKVKWVNYSFTQQSNNQSHNNRD